MQAQELTPEERTALEAWMRERHPDRDLIGRVVAGDGFIPILFEEVWLLAREFFAARDAVVGRPGESRKPWTGRSLFEFFEHEAERGRGWDSLAERIEREIDGIRGVAGQKIAKLAREAAESPNTSDHENALWEIIDLCAPVASRVSEEPAKSWTIRVCAEPGCGGWAAKHFADAVGIWHDHGGRRVDFVDVEVVPR